jgi:hypothetical protein
MMKASAASWASRSTPSWIKPQNEHRRTEYLAGKRRIVYPAGELEEVIKESEAILTLPANWDDAGSPAFRKATWERAIRMLTAAASFLWATRSLEITAPNISPGPEGSIDLHWKTERRELLINIPEDPNEPAPYYGDDYGADKQKGTIAPGNLNASLFVWLTQTD